jgi:hypothetical protein
LGQAYSTKLGYVGTKNSKYSRNSDHWLCYHSVNVI